MRALLHLLSHPYAIVLLGFVFVSLIEVPR